ncbi:MAG: hypothetical protein ACLGGX_12260 [Bdellovibrionia bacterium]
MLNNQDIDDKLIANIKDTLALGGALAPKRFKNFQADIPVYGTVYDSTLTPRLPQQTLKNFDSVFKDHRLYDYFITEIKKAEAIARQYVKSARYCLIHISSQCLGENLHRHAHILREGTKFTHTLSVAIPIYVNPQEQNYFFSSCKWGGFSSEVYDNLLAAKNLNVSYDKILLSPSKPTTIAFDSHQNIHYVNHTSSIYMWFVLDGIEFHNRDWHYRLINNPGLIWQI